MGSNKKDIEPGKIKEGIQYELDFSKTPPGQIVAQRDCVGFIDDSKYQGRVIDISSYNKNKLISDIIKNSPSY